MTSSATTVLTPEQYVARHKQAFRAAFDFLNTHFPPAFDDVWWIRTANDCADMSAANAENPLVSELLVGVLTYLEGETKLREEIRDGTKD